MDGLLFPFTAMKTKRHFSSAPGRRIAALICLAAIILMWAPAWAMAWQVGGMACCNGGMCPAHGHAGTGQSSTNQTAPAPVNCEHHHGKKLAGCSMSCCHESGQALNSAIAFVMPVPSGIAVPALEMASFMDSAPPEFVPSFKPPAPPPRTSQFSL